MPGNHFRIPLFSIVALAALFLFLPLQDARPADPATEYLHARQLFLEGELEKCQESARLGFLRFQNVDPEWASRFRLLEAQSMLYRGLRNDALALLAPFHPDANHANERVEQLAIEAEALAYLHKFQAAGEDLSQAEPLCVNSSLAACGQVLRARGIMAIEREQLPAARQFFLECQAFARARHDPELESNAWLNLGSVSLHDGHYDEAVDWSRDAYAASMSLGNQNRAQAALGNTGWAYFELGDSERALPLLLEAEQSAARLGNIRDQLKWLSTVGFFHEGSGDFARAATAYNQALAVAEQINSKEDIINTLEVLAHLSIETGKLDQAGAYLDQLAPLLEANPNRLDQLDVLLAQGRIAAARGQNAQAESLFRTVASDPASQTSMRLGAEHELAKLDERRGDLVAADRMYATALAAFEQARSQLQNEDSKIPFLANAEPIYDDYINLLVRQGRTGQALVLADHSRARTLAAGLGLTIPAQPVALDVGRIARETGATLLFYWLGHTQSWLWAITPQKTTLFPLPASAEIARMASRYRDALLGPDDPLDTANADGQALYRTLLAPAAPLIAPGGNVVILADGALSQLNFETLLVPAPRLHYWIDDATVVSAPSLAMLASAAAIPEQVYPGAVEFKSTPPSGSGDPARLPKSPQQLRNCCKPSSAGGRSLLLVGDAVSGDPDYPALPKASVEMREIERHFPAADETIFAGPRAKPEAYMDSAPQQFAYIHFVAHGVASATDPLDSAIILSRSAAADDSFKLYARAIIQHPIHARLVTISSCYGGGTRSYAGEGLVGLSWAFLRAGAHNVIGALWEVSDDSTPALMDQLYAGLEKGMPPSAALRQAQLHMLHSPGDFRSPFFWAPFQLYTGL
jgi:CHAT domain-containing protein